MEESYVDVSYGEKLMGRAIDGRISQHNRGLLISPRDASRRQTSSQ